MTFRRLSISALALLALVPAACGGDDAPSVDNPGQSPSTTEQAEQDTGGGATPAEGTVEVQMKDFQFLPASIDVKVGQKISWRNEDTAEHDATSEKSGLETELIGQGETIDFTPEKAGTIEYVCSIHPNMTGTINVTDQ